MIEDPEDILDGEAREVIQEMEKLDKPDYQRLYLKESQGEDRLAVKQWLENRGDFAEDEIDEMREKEAIIKEEMERQGIDDVSISELMNSSKNFDHIKKKLEKIHKESEGKDIDESEDEDSTEEQIETIVENSEDDIADFYEKMGEVNSKISDKHGHEPKNDHKNEEELIQKKNREKKEEIVEEHFGDKDVDYKEEAGKKHFNLSEDETIEDFEERIEKHKHNFEEAIEMMQNVIIGQDEVLERVMVSLMANGHILMEGVPGLGKSLTVETLAQTVKDTDFNRIQFVPDMLPSDILGQRIYNQDKGEFYTNKGPVFTNFLLADEINRAPPKTQAAMMEVMQEEKVSIENEEYELDPPYLVLATQNPLEQKGTYPLPEAVIDRFFMKLNLEYPSPEDEVDIMQESTLSTTDPFKDLHEVLSAEQILQAQEDVKKIHVSPKVQKYIVEIVVTARGEIENDVELMDYIDYGPGPRASIWLYLGACAYAILDGRKYALPDDVKKVAKPVLRHRLMMNYEGKISDHSADDVTEEILEKIDPT
ncbi:MAG: MoxR family ATPase [Candidatus Nanohaloarchaea archaeon]